MVSGKRNTDAEEWLRTAIADLLGIEDEAIGPKFNLMRDGEADSLDLVELDMQVEEAFGVVFPDGEDYPQTFAGWLEVIGSRPLLVKHKARRRRRTEDEQFEFEKADALL